MNPLKLDPTQMVDEIAKQVIIAIKPQLKIRKSVDDTIFTVKTLAQYLRVSTQWIYDKVTNNTIPYIKIGKFIRFKKSDISKWLDDSKMPAINSPLRILK